MNFFIGLTAIILAAVVISVLLVSWKLSSLIVVPKTVDPDKCYIDEIEKGEINKEKYEHTYNREDFTLKSDYGYNLSGSFIPRKSEMPLRDNHERAVVIVHGYTSCQFGSAKYIDIFNDLGFNCVIYDHRNHGYSEKNITTMGFCEARDLKQICDWTRKKLGEETIIGTHGESMGAATVMMNAPLDDKLAFVIEDCGYSSLVEQLGYNMKNAYHLPRFPFLYIASFFSKLRGGIFFHQVVPLNQIASCKNIPMLFIHGEIDDFVPIYMVHDLFKAKKGYRRIKTFPNASHAESYWNNQAEYTKEIEEFLREIKII